MNCTRGAPGAGVSQPRTRLFDVTMAAESAGVSRPTLYAWIEKGAIVHQFNVMGRPVFTQPEMQQIVTLANQRKAVLSQWPVT